MVLVDIPFLRFGKNDIARPWLPTTIVNPHSGKQADIYGLIDTGADECALPATYAYAHTVQLKIKGLKTRRTLIDFLPNLQVPLLGMKNFLANFILTIDYPRSRFSLQKQ